jgi:DNA polymerase-3 subunit beta
VDEPSEDADSGKPAERAGSYRYLIMPVRLPG